MRLSFNWSIPFNDPYYSNYNETDDFKIKITDLSGLALPTTFIAESSFKFSGPKFILNSVRFSYTPLKQGKEVDISWNDVGIENVYITLQKDGVDILDLSGGDSISNDTQKFTWEVPYGYQYGGTGFTVKITDVSGIASNQLISSPFVIEESKFTQGSLLIKDLSGTTVLGVNQDVSYNIVWQNKGFIENVRIDLSSNSGTTNLVSNIPNTNTYPWKPEISAVVSGFPYRIIVSDERQNSLNLSKQDLSKNDYVFVRIPFSDPINNPCIKVLSTL